MIFQIKNMIRKLSHQNILIKKTYALANIFQAKLLGIILDDENFAKFKYKSNTGRTLDLKNPQTFNEKLWWLKINNRDPLLTRCSDKVEVRNYVKECGLSHILNEVYGVYNKPEDINFDDLPEKAFIKTNHGSGKNIKWDRNNPFNKKAFIKEFRKSMKNNYFLQSREWNYKNITPKIIVERLYEQNDFHSILDYKFLCFNGKVKVVFVDIDLNLDNGRQNPRAKRNMYDENFNFIDITMLRRPQHDRTLIEKPINFEKMIEYSEILAKPFVHCRVDLYNFNGDIYFGEITFYNGGATEIVEPEEWEYKMGEWIDLNSNKIKK